MHASHHVHVVNISRRFFLIALMCSSTPGTFSQILDPPSAPIQSTCPAQRDVNDAHAHYFRIPKTGSTSFIMTYYFSPCYREKLIVHSHVNGCGDGRPCNASCFRFVGPTFAVLRHPCARFASLVAHLPHLGVSSYLGLKDNDSDGSRRWHQSVDRMIDFYAALNCSGAHDDVGCIVRSTSAVVHEWGTQFEHERVMFWPQAFYINAETTISCMQGDNDVLNDLFEQISQATNCPIPQRDWIPEKMRPPSSGNLSIVFNHRHQGHQVLNSEQCSAVMGIFRQDTALWKDKCSQGRH